MQIGKLRVRNFRSILDVELDLGRCTALCGPNSCGKSNVLSALVFALSSDISKEQIYNNLPRHLRETQGAPKLSIWVEFEIKNVSSPIAALAKCKPGETVLYTFRAIRTGHVTRRLNSEPLADGSMLSKHFSVTYVPAQRDLHSEGMPLFQQIFSDALRRARGTRSLRRVTATARDILQEKADSLLSQAEEAARLLGVRSLSGNTKKVDLEGLYQQVQLNVRDSSGSRPLSELGTGHQSTVVVQLYRQLASKATNSVVLLVEEPDTHLHPLMIRSVAADLLQLSAKHQVIVTTHSPILLDALGIDRAIPLGCENGVTVVREVDVRGLDTIEVRRVVSTMNLRATEPLLANMVIAVEGPLDSAILSACYRNRNGRSPDDDGVLIFNCGGKFGLATACELMEACGIPWWAVVDWDVAFDDERPRTRGGLSETERLEGIAAIDKLETLLEGTNRRGRSAQNNLRAIAAELNGARPSPQALIRSPLERLLTLKGITLDHKRALISYFKANRRREAASLVREYGVILWQNEIEDAVLPNTSAVNVAEAVLIKNGILPGVVGGAHRERDIRSHLSKLAFKPRIVDELVASLTQARVFNRTEINPALRALFE